MSLFFRCHLRLILSSLTVFVILFVSALVLNFGFFLVESLVASEPRGSDADFWKVFVKNNFLGAMGIVLVFQPIIHSKMLVSKFFSKFDTMEQYYRNIEKLQTDGTSRLPWSKLVGKLLLPKGR